MPNPVRLKLEGLDGNAFCLPFDWPSAPRTMREAHRAIIKADWNALVNGQVIDVEYELGETDAPKQAEA